jgi:pimeloyl-ACP methyl ester carboxylesterase
MKPLRAALLLALAATLTAQNSPWRDPSTHTVQMIAVDGDVRLEVLDWGGSGRPVVLLAGLGNTAHVFDDFAPKLATGFHVYGITRRGFGASSLPASGYDADRLGDDVVAVVEALKLPLPVIAGHSMSGEELSSVAARHAARIAGLVYLDAVQPYAFDNGAGWTLEDFRTFVNSAPNAPPPGKDELATASARAAWYRRTRGVSFPESEVYEMMAHNSPGRVGRAIQEGTKSFTQIKVPVLAICALPRDVSADLRSFTDPDHRAMMEGVFVEMQARMEKQIASFQNGVPGARVVVLPGANHYVFLSNEADVLRDMKTFIGKLP